MLTIIYVNEPATLTIEAREKRDEHALVRRYDGAQPTRELQDLRVNGTVAFDKGVYAILSRQALRISWSTGRVETATLSKDVWPDPPALDAGASSEQLHEFFSSLAKGGDV
jgi:hypothetical protein